MMKSTKGNNSATARRSSFWPYLRAFQRIESYLWDEERRDFEANDERNGHVFPALQAMKAWLERGIPEFSLGRVVATANTQETLTAIDIQDALDRHAVGDWGDVCEDDWKENELSLREGFRLFSVFHAEDGTRFWVITEADRLATTVLLPEDY